MPNLYYRFNHNLGDSVCFAHLLHLYRSRNYTIACDSNHEAQVAFDAAGVIHHKGPTFEAAHVIAHPWFFFKGYNEPTPDPDWSGSQLASNLNRSPLPVLREPFEALWDELCNTRLQSGGLIPSTVRDSVRKFVGNLPKPIVLVQTTGESRPEVTDLPSDIIAPLCWSVLRSTKGSIVVLDEDGRNPVPSHPRIKVLRNGIKDVTTYHLLSLFEEAGVLVAVVGSAYQLAKLSNIPVVGIWPWLHPSCNTLPNLNAINMVPNDLRFKLVNIARMPRWNIVEYDGLFPDTATVAIHASRFLEAPRYLPGHYRGRDVMMQHWVRDLSDVKGLDWLLREIKSRYVEPDIVEVGCSKYKTDWSGRGNSTYLLAAIADSTGGTFTCLDKDTSAVAKQCKKWNNGVYLSANTSEAIAWDQGLIDVLFLNEEIDLSNCRGLHKESLVIINKNGNVAVREERPTTATVADLSLSPAQPARP